MGVMHSACAKHQAVAFRTTKNIVCFLKAAFHSSKRSILDHAAVGIVGKFPDAGGIPDGGCLSQMVVGELPSRRIVIVGDGEEFSGKGGIGIGGDDPSGLGERVETIEVIVSLERTGAVGIGLVQFQPRRFVVEPCGGVPIGSIGRIGSDVFFVCPESGQRDHTVGFVVRETSRLNGGAVLGCLSSADVIGIADSASQGVDDGSHGIATGKVAGHSHAASCVRGLDSTSSKIRLLNSSVDATIGFFQNHACRGIGALLRGVDASVIRLAYYKAVDDQRLCNDIRSRNPAEPGAPGGSGVLTPPDTLMAVNICSDGFVFQYSAESGNQGLRSLNEGEAIGVVGRGSLYLIDAIFPNLVTGEGFRYPVTGSIFRMEGVQ